MMLAIQINFCFFSTYLSFWNHKLTFILLMDRCKGRGKKRKAKKIQETFLSNSTEQAPNCNNPKDRTNY